MRMFIYVFILLTTGLNNVALAATDDYPLDKAHYDLYDTESLQRGAKLFMNYCSGCHGLKYQRYQRTFNDLAIPEEQGISTLQYTGNKVTDYMTSSMSSDDAAAWFGAAPPDLTLVARVRGADWIYTYLRSFYRDDSRPFGVNNLVFPDVGMPHVLEPLQGATSAIPSDQMDENNKSIHYKGVESDGSGTLTSEEYDQVVLDLVNFLEYVGEPTRLASQRMGKWVLAFILVFGVLAYLLKVEYWRDVK